MRRAAPIFIIVIAVLAIVIDFVALPMPSNDGTTRRLETKLGLDLRGGLRIEYQVLPAEGESAVARRPRRHAPDHRQPHRQVGRRRAPGRRPRAPTGSSSRCRASRTRTRSATSSAQTGRLDFVPLGQTQMVQDQDVGGDVLATKCDETTTELCVLFSGDQVAAATIGANETGQRTVNFTLTGEGKDRFAQYTADHVDDYFAIVLDGKVITAPVHQEPDHQRPGRDRVGRHRRLPARGDPEPRHDPAVRPAAVPDPGARQHDGQPDARRGVPPAERARGR